MQRVRARFDVLFGRVWQGHPSCGRQYMWKHICKSAGAQALQEADVQSGMKQILEMMKSHTEVGYQLVTHELDLTNWPSSYDAALTCNGCAARAFQDTHH